MSAGHVAPTLSSRFARPRKFWARVYQKSANDKIFFMAGAISYNLLIAVVPLFLLAVGVWGYVLPAFGEPSEVIIGLLENYIPEMEGIERVVITKETILKGKDPLYKNSRKRKSA